MKTTFIITLKNDLPYSLCEFLHWWCQSNSESNSQYVSTSQSGGTKLYLIVTIFFTTTNSKEEERGREGKGRVERKREEKEGRKGRRQGGGKEN